MGTRESCMDRMQLELGLGWKNAMVDQKVNFCKNVTFLFLFFL